jgi:hypothetical protein
MDKNGFLFLSQVRSTGGLQFCLDRLFLLAGLANLKVDRIGLLPRYASGLAGLGFPFSKSASISLCFAKVNPRPARVANCARRAALIFPVGITMRNGQTRLQFDFGRDGIFRAPVRSAGESFASWARLVRAYRPSDADRELKQKAQPKPKRW